MTAGDDEDLKDGVVSTWRPIWWDAADRIRIDLLDGKRLEADVDHVELLAWGVSVTTGAAWPWHMVRAIRVLD